MLYKIKIGTTTHVTSNISFTYYGQKLYVHSGERKVLDTTVDDPEQWIKDHITILEPLQTPVLSPYSHRLDETPVVQHSLGFHIIEKEEENGIEQNINKDEHKSDGETTPVGKHEKNKKRSSK